MRTVEQFIKGKKADDSLCEDALYIGDKLVAVIDGVTTKGGRMICGRKSGRFARDVLLSTLENHPDLYLLSPSDFFRFMNNELTQAVVNSGENPAKAEYPRAGMIVFNGYKSEIWNYGDCQGIVSGKLLDYSKTIDTINSTVRAMYLEAALLNGSTIDDLRKDDVGRTAILKNLVLQFEFENIEGEFGYPILNGINFNEKMIKTEIVPEGSEVVLASDGYPYLKGTLEESEKELQRLLQSDPLCFREYRSTKGLESAYLSFDDRTYWRGYAY